MWFFPSIFKTFNTHEFKSEEVWLLFIGGNNVSNDRHTIPHT